jgi:NADH-dependent peroxiredoxin subunit F
LFFCRFSKIFIFRRENFSDIKLKSENNKFIILNLLKYLDKKEKMFDLIIIGAGPAGMTAAIYAARRKLNFIIISLDIGGQMGWSPEVDNYPGVPDKSGIALTEQFNQHLKEYKINVKNEDVIRLEKKENLCIITTKNNVYESKAVIIASGKKPRKLGVPGEDKLIGKGVNYCATCDSPLYKDKIVAVCGGGNSGMEAALFLTKYAKKVYLLEALPKLGGDALLKDKIMNEKKIEVLTSIKVKEIIGDKTVKAIKAEKEGKEQLIKLDGIFVEIGLISQYDFTDVQKNKWGEIMISRSTISHEENMTDISGIFAAGDCTDIPSKQIIVAAGVGAKAALAAIKYIDNWK